MVTPMDKAELALRDALGSGDLVATVRRLFNEGVAARFELQSAIARAEAAEARERGLLDELTAYRDAALYDAMMEGPLFKAWNHSQLDRARRLTEAAALAAVRPGEK